MQSLHIKRLFGNTISKLLTVKRKPIMIRLSNHQLFTLMLTFEIGSTTLFALGIDAKQDAWIVILIALLIGTGFIWVYTELQNSFPDKNFVEIIIAILGKLFGIPLVCLYILSCLWVTSRNLREFGELIKITILPKTPLWIILFLFLLVSIYTLIKGTETLARASEIILPILIFSIVLAYIFLALSKKLDFKRLMPIAPNGIMPIIKAVPSVAMFPFGEMYIFLMYWRYAAKKEDVRKVSMKVILLSGILLTLSSIVNIGVLGAKYTAITTIPFVETIKLINIENIITNIDSIAIIIIFFGGFFKMSVYLNATILALKSLFKTEKYKLILFIFSAILFWFSIVFEKNYMYHKWMFPFDSLYFQIIYSNVFPLLLLIVYLIKKKRAEL